MKRLVLIGASGMAGSNALRFALEHPNVEKVLSIGRKPLGFSHPRLSEVRHPDFADCSALKDVLVGYDAVIFCLGTYTGAVSEEELRKITVHYTMEFANVLREASPEASFTFLSGKGADPTGKSRIPYARFKGAAENALVGAGFSHVYIFRPAYIYPVMPRKEPNVGYRLFRLLYPLFRLAGLAVRSDDLGRTMVEVSARDTREPKNWILENRDILALERSTS
jgi:uncharacterized protein YbjT (DUF2867 family)